MVAGARAGHPDGVADTADIRVLVVDDHPAVRAGLEAMLEAEEGIELVGAAATATEALELAKALRPAAVVVDYHLPDEDGLSLCLRLKSSFTPAPRVLVHSAFADERLATLAAVAGADAVLSKSGDPEELLAALHSSPARWAPCRVLSPRALESAGASVKADDLPILGMLAHGTSPVEVAETLGIEERSLYARRWGMLERMRGGHVQRTTLFGGRRRVSAA
jgi:DNA-binding NarL/FixJ family response regulator